MSDKPQKQTSKARAFEHLAPIRVWVKSNHGSIQKLTGLISERTGEKTARHTISRWLTQKEEKFQQPSLGHTIILSECVEYLQTKNQK